MFFLIVTCVDFFVMGDKLQSCGFQGWEATNLGIRVFIRSERFLSDVFRSYNFVLDSLDSQFSRQKEVKQYYRIG